ncbi:hypothetical protein JQ615_05540 [Bradyrhizobium jicamae]|uniref:Uncharacterized protein n=1 Tax=Bradyrhizobium jicamae TaxID=280332 RepID=A0ABS5FDI5_9BRAD|nr:hypothetical protein [Bradyrhizobium jicamae]MBR0794853.1 hypothetical protein [Bradyrhizobium jicamae]
MPSRLERLRAPEPTAGCPVNPFAKIGLRSSDRETPTATFEELIAFRRKAAEMDLRSPATASLIAWERLRRETDMTAKFARQTERLAGSGEDALTGPLFPFFRLQPPREIHWKKLACGPYVGLSTTLH